MNVVFEDRPDKRLACIRHIGPYETIGSSFAKLSEWIETTGIDKNRLGEMTAIYYDDPSTTPPDQLRSDAAIEIPDDATIVPGAVECRLSGGRHARYTHMGSYRGLGEAWGRFFGEGVPSIGAHPTGAPCFEVYRNDCRTVPEEEVRTDLYIPVQP